MRILIAIGVRRQKEAGAAGVVLNHARELEKLGHSVECWFLDDILDARHLGTRFEALLFSVAIAKRIQKKRTAFEVANLHAPWGGAYGIWRKLFHPPDSPPYVMTMQGSEERYVQAMRIEDRKGRAAHFSWKNRLWHRAYHQTLYDCSIRSADFGAVANREAWIMAELKYGRQPGRIWFVPNGVEERFLISREYRDGGPLRLLYVGTWLDRKGVYYLAEAFEQVAAKFPYVTLTVAGCIAPEEEVKKYFRSGLGDKIRVIPFVQREEMPAVYMEHDIFVFPSLVEGMPLTLLEAMATGMPVAATNTCGMADVLNDGVNGLLVPAADGGALAAAVEQLVASGKLRRQLGTAAQESVRGYTWGRVTQKLAGVFELAVESEKRNRGSGRTRGEEMR